ncbi:MAG: aminotransferase class IV [Flavisolibacter sp.]
MKHVFINNDFIEESKACLPVSDLAIQRGYAVFDFFRLAGNRPLFLEQHLDRFFHSAHRLRLPVPFEREGLRDVIRQLLIKNDLPDTGIKMTLTGGCSADGVTPSTPNFIISQHSFSTPSATQQEKGIVLKTYPHQRQLADVKSTDYLMAIWLQPLLQESGADDLLYHFKNQVSESPRSNFFLITVGDTVVTPAEDMLKGITRNNLIKVAKDHFAVEERAVTVEELATAKAAFITSTTKQILPVRQIDDVVYTDFTAVKKLQQLLQQFTGL